MKKKVVLPLVIGLLVFGGLAGCGKQDKVVTTHKSPVAQAQNNTNSANTQSSSTVSDGQTKNNTNVQSLNNSLSEIDQLANSINDQDINISVK